MLDVDCFTVSDLQRMLLPICRLLLQMMGHVIVTFSRNKSTRFPGMFISGDSIVELLRDLNTLNSGISPQSNPVRRMKIRLRFDKPRYRQESRRVNQLKSKELVYSIFRITQRSFVRSFVCSR